MPTSGKIIYGLLVVRDKSLTSVAHSAVDETDRRLIAFLRDEARLSVTELASRADISRANAYQRLGRLIASRVIRRFTVDVDQRALGNAITALILMDIDQHAWRSVENDVIELPGVELVALTTGTFDVVVLVRAPDMETLRDVVLERLQSMPAVRSTQTSFVLEERVR
ncbi:MAG TPA: Lrp/AsnC family transcriptional regulator [Acidimicrobiales bacterium]|nr:Lrp/AsnC family transcriptional regulator [Acidimicrobiales bacterium]